MRYFRAHPKVARSLGPTGSRGVAGFVFRLGDPSPVPGDLPEDRLALILADEYVEEVWNAGGGWTTQRPETVEEPAETAAAPPGGAPPAKPSKKKPASPKEDAPK